LDAEETIPETDFQPEDESQDIPAESGAESAPEPEPEPKARPRRGRKASFAGTSQPGVKSSAPSAPIKKSSPPPENPPPPRSAAAKAGVKLPKIPAKFKGSLRAALATPANQLKLAADPCRASIILLLIEQERLNVGQICVGLDMASQPAVSHHLAILRNSRAIVPAREGKNNFYSLTDSGQALARALQVMMA
jgi:DNA-binding transcriptional ArsR family regulator